jgi:magnesium transporter
LRLLLCWIRFKYLAHLVIVMSKLFSGRYKKTGFQPGEMLYTGERSQEPNIHILQYNKDEVIETNLKTLDRCVNVNKKYVTWVNVDSVSNPALIEKIGECMSLNPLTMEDILTIGQRPKCENFKDYTFVILNMLRFNKSENSITKEQLSMILSENIVITFQDGMQGDVFDKLRYRIRENKGKIREKGVDFLFYSLMDAVIDEYFMVLENVGENIESIEETLLSSKKESTVHLIQSMKKELVFLRKEIWPVRELLIELDRNDSKFIRKETKVFMRDIYDHIAQLIDTVEILRDILSEQFDIYLSDINNRINEVMKFLTVIMTVFMPLTFLTGLYGMNFKFMPGLDNPFGFFIMLGIMASVTLVMLFFFKTRKLI